MDESEPEPWFPAPFAPMPRPEYAPSIPSSPSPIKLVLPSPHPRLMRDKDWGVEHNSNTAPAYLDREAGSQLPADATAAAPPLQGSAANAHGSTNGLAVATVEEEAAHGAHAVPAVARHPVAAEPATEARADEERPAEEGGDMAQPKREKPGRNQLTRRRVKCSRRRGSRRATWAAGRNRRTPAESPAWKYGMMIPASMLFGAWLSMMLLLLIPQAGASPVAAPAEPAAMPADAPAGAQASQLAHPMPAGPAVQVYDCSDPRFLGTYDRETFCTLSTPADPPTAPETMTWTLSLAQEAWHSQRQGYRCHGTKRITAHMCGLWSYEKALPSLSTMEVLTISAENCALMALKGIYVLDDSRVLQDIAAPGRSEVHYPLNGMETIEDGNAWCQGETVVVSGQRIDRVVRSVKLELIVANETFLVDERTKEVFAEGEREEVACPSDTRAAGTPNMFGCQGAMATYAWHGPTRPFCPLHFVNSMVGEVAKKEGKIVFSSPQAMARFEISHAGQVEHECLRAWYRTSVDNVWASRDKHLASTLKKIQGAEVDPLIEVMMLKAYLQHQLTKRPTHTPTNHQSACRESLAAAADELNFRIADGKFGRVKGDAVIVFSCTMVEAPLREAETCHRDVPVHHELMPFADSLTRILRAESPRVACTSHFAQAIKGVKGWWHLTPAIRQAAEPSAWAPADVEAEGGEAVPRSFYTHAEREAWEKVQMLPVYKQQITTMLEMGSCGKDTNCPIQTVGAEGGYDWSTLERAVPGYSTYETFKEVGHYALMLGSILGLLLAVPVAWLLYQLKQIKSSNTPAGQQSVNVAVKYEASAPEAKLLLPNRYPGLD